MSVPWRRFIIAVLWGAAASAVVLPFGSAFIVYATQEAVAAVLPAAAPHVVFEALETVALSVGFGLPGAMVAACLAIRGPRDTETRCRKCGHILRGITEPRCPECGERI